MHPYCLTFLCSWLPTIGIFSTKFTFRCLFLIDCVNTGQDRSKGIVQLFVAVCSFHFWVIRVQNSSCGYYAWKTNIWKVSFECHGLHSTTPSMSIGWPRNVCYLVEVIWSWRVNSIIPIHVIGIYKATLSSPPTRIPRSAIITVRWIRSQDCSEFSSSVR